MRAVSGHSGGVPTGPIGIRPRLGAIPMDLAFDLTLASWVDGALRGALIGGAVGLVFGLVRHFTQKR